MRALRAFALAAVCWSLCGIAFASELTADFALRVCDTWKSDHDAALALLVANGWSDAGAQQRPFESEPMLQLNYSLHESQLHPATPAQGVVPVFTLEEAAFGNLRVTSCEARVSTDSAPFMSLQQTREWLASRHFRGHDDEAGASPLGMVIFRASRNDGSELSWATAGTWHALAFPNLKIWRIRFQSAVRMQH
jgi:hypothetical protein